MSKLTGMQVEVSNKEGSYTFVEFLPGTEEGWDSAVVIDKEGNCDSVPLHFLTFNPQDIKDLQQ